MGGSKEEIQCEGLSFCPKKRINRHATRRVIELGAITFKSILQNMMNLKKATHRYLSRDGLKWSWMMCPESIKKVTLGLEATINYSDRSLGGTTHEMVGEMDIGIDLSAQKRR